MGISILNLLAPQAKADTNVGVQAAGQQGQAGQGNGNPFAQMLDGQVVATGNGAMNAEAGGIKAFQPIVQLLDKLQALQLQINELPEGANLAESVVNLAAFQSLPTPMQHLLQQGMAEGKISTVADMHQLLGAVQNALTEALPPALQAKLDGYLEGEKNKASVGVALGEATATDTSEKEAPAKEEAKEILPEGLQLLLADIMAALQRSTHVSSSAKDLLGHGEMAVGGVVPGLKPQVADAGEKEIAKPEADMLMADIETDASDDAADLLDATALKNAITNSIATQKDAKIASDTQAFIAEATDEAVSKQAAISAAANVIESVEEQVANDNVVRVPLEQPVRLSPLSAGGSNNPPTSTEKNKTNSAFLASHSVAIPSAMMANEAASGHKLTYDPLKDIPAGHTAQQVLGRISIKPHRDQNDYTIQLDPIELGKVEIKMSINKHGEVHLSMMVDNRAALEALQRDARFLEKGLQDAGLKMDAGNMNFNLKDDTQQQAAGQFTDNMNRDGQGRQPAEGRAGLGYKDGQVAAETTLDIILPRRATMADGLDIRV